MSGVVQDAGIDTWSVCWRVAEGHECRKALEALCIERGPRSMLLPGSINDHRVGWFPGVGLVFAEGHPGGVDGEGVAVLGKPEVLPEVTQGLVDSLGQLGIQLPNWQLSSTYGLDRGREVTKPVMGGTGFAGVRRLDSTVNLRFSHPAEGMAVLTGVAGLPLPRMKTKVTREVGGSRVETVEFRGYSGRRILGRWYDKGVESGLAGRGLFIRPEDQRRYASSGRLTVEAVAGSTYVRDAFLRRFEPLWLAAKGVKVAGMVDLVRKMQDLQAAGLVTPVQAERLLGYILMRSSHVETSEGRTEERRRSECRRLGLVIDDGVLERVDVDLSSMLEEAFDSEHWGNRN